MSEIEKKKEKKLLFHFLYKPTCFLFNNHFSNTLSLQEWWVSVEGIVGTCSSYYNKPNSFGLVVLGFSKDDLSWGKDGLQFAMTTPYRCLVMKVTSNETSNFLVWLYENPAKIHPVGKLPKKLDWKDKRLWGTKIGICGQARKRGLEPDERVCAQWQDGEAGQNY